MDEKVKQVIENKETFIVHIPTVALLAVGASLGLGIWGSYRIRKLEDKVDKLQRVRTACKAQCIAQMVVNEDTETPSKKTPKKTSNK